MFATWETSRVFFLPFHFVLAPRSARVQKKRRVKACRKSSFSARRVEKVFFLHSKTENSRTFRADLQKKEEEEVNSSFHQTLSRFLSQ